MRKLGLNDQKVSHIAYLVGKMDITPIIFEDWEPVLRAAVPLDRYRAYREAIVKFRYWLRDTGWRPGRTFARFRNSWAMPI